MDRSADLRTERSSGDTGLRIRGLPYAYDAWDVENIFAGHPFLRGSVKLGHRGNLKSGEAVILFDTHHDAARALMLNGLVVDRRFLELTPVNKDEYYRFK